MTWDEWYEQNEDVLREQYDMFLDDLDGPVKLLGVEYDASQVLKEVDEIAYEVGFDDWYDDLTQDYETPEEFVATF